MTGKEKVQTLDFSGTPYLAIKLYGSLIVPSIIDRRKPGKEDPISQQSQLLFLSSQLRLAESSTFWGKCDLRLGASVDQKSNHHAKFWAQKQHNMRSQILCAFPLSFVLIAECPASSPGKGEDKYLKLLASGACQRFDERWRCQAC